MSLAAPSTCSLPFLFVCWFMHLPDLHWANATAPLATESIQNRNLTHVVDFLS